MVAPYVNIHTHCRCDEGIEVVSVMAVLGVLPQDVSQPSFAPGVLPQNITQPPFSLGVLPQDTSQPQPPFSLGIHPWQLTGLEVHSLGDLSAALDAIEASDASAIGEIGLDYAVAISGDRALRALQEQVFTAQLRLAESSGRPVILHNVKAFEPTLVILANYRLPAVIFHGFIGSEQQAARATGRGYFLSFGERSLASPKTVQALKRTPLKQVFLETDVSMLSIRDTYTQAASSLQIPIEELARQLFENYQEVFGHDRSMA